MNKTTVAQQAKTASFLSPAQGILQRKCTCGNHTVAGGECAACGKNKSGLQRKLTIGAGHDPLEQEADRVADQVMAAPLNSAVRGALLHIQRFTGQSTAQKDTAPGIVDRVLSSPGRPLDPALRQDMEQRFGYDFSRVRVHSGAAAELSAQEVQANAYTVGHNVVFGVGRFTPGTHEGRRLIAHELTHVVQQSGSDGIRVGQGNGKGGLAPASSPISPATPVLRRQPAPGQSASRVLANCDVLGGSKERKCNIDQLSKAVIAALSSSPRAYVTVSERTSPSAKGGSAGDAFNRADLMRQALIQWIGPDKFPDARFEAGVIEGAEGEPQVEIRVAYRPQVQSDPRTPLAPTPNQPPLSFIPPPRQVGAPGVPPPPAGPSKDDPRSAEDKQKEWDATITTGPKKTADELKAKEREASTATQPEKTAEELKAEELDNKTLEDAGAAILDAFTKTPGFKNLETQKIDPFVDKLPTAVPLAGIAMLVPIFVGLHKTRGKLPVPKPPAIKISTGKVALGIDTRVQFIFRGPINSPTEITASFTFLKSARPSKLPEGAEINVALTAKFPESGKAIGSDNPGASQSVVFTLTIPLPGDPKPKK